MLLEIWDIRVCRLVMGGWEYVIQGSMECEFQYSFNFIYVLYLVVRLYIRCELSVMLFWIFGYLVNLFNVVYFELLIVFFNVIVLLIYYVLC